jgi:hypothetical protein
MTGAVVIDNNTGAPIEVASCGTEPAFAVVLGDNVIPATVAWAMNACVGHAEVPRGPSSYPVTILARYSACNPVWNQPNDLPRCLPPGIAPPLPSGDYSATFFQKSSTFPAASPVVVHVQPSG